MTDFYAKKIEALDMCEESIKSLTLKGKSADQGLLLVEINRKTGFSKAVMQHLDNLVAAGNVERIVNKKGKIVLTWAG